MSRPSTINVQIFIRPDTAVMARELPSGNWSLMFGEWPQPLTLLGSRDELRGVLHRALGELADGVSRSMLLSDRVEGL